MINNVSLVGRTTKDIELRKTESGISVVTFTLAVNRIGSDTTDFINCVAWRQTAEYMSSYIKKGYLLGVTGSIQTRNYQDNSGKTIYVTEVICNSVQNLQPKENQAPEEKQFSLPDDLPF